MSVKRKVTDEELKIQYEADFDPEVYLNSVYRKPGDGDDEHFADYVKFAASNFHRIFTIDLPPGGETMLDLGCGPTVYAVISASDRYKNIVMAEFLQQNRNAVTKWLRNDPDAFDWTYVFETVAKLEKEPDHKKLEARVRNLIKEVIPCDLTLANPLTPIERKFDVILTAGVYEAIATDDASFKRMVARTAELLEPNGRLIYFGVFNATFYKPGASTFYAFPASKDLVDEAMVEAGLEVDLWLTSPTHTKDKFKLHFTDFFIVVAKKNRH